MNDPFFARTKSKKSKKATNNKEKNKIVTGKKRKFEANDDEESIPSSEDEVGPGLIDDMDMEHNFSEEDDEEAHETPAEKRRRLAKQYIDSVREDLDEAGFDAAEIDRDLIGQRLRKEALEASGRLHRELANAFKFPIDPSKIKSRRHELSVTCVATTDSAQFFYTGSKDGTVKKWDIKTGKKLHVFPGGRKELKEYDGHNNVVLALAVSSDGKYLASGGADKKINIWSVQDNTLMTCFKQHKEGITGLAFRKGSNQLYSASNDRTIKLWNVDEKGYIETLFGHQDQITAIDTLARERCVTVGGRDRTCRLWKIVEESQLVFRSGSKTEKDDKAHQEGCLDAIALIDEEHFLSGSDSGAISLWSVQKKKPIFVYDIAHGTQITNSESQSHLSPSHWIISLATLRYSDVFASGSWDGNIRLWKLTNNIHSFEPLTKIPIIGFVNSLQFTTVEQDSKPNETTRATTTLLIAGVGQEHKFGRWERIKKARNGWRMIELPLINVTS
ncbi:8460_t:CDS:2 [Ambispora gerdemannii]|uniref:8460_t:CDS:1 n=1 Tax=Ambispora gerdemannii TaxID=144530 RepID=A0A9N8Z585_9GLOM|nr:8460_t:CDS:2 [Ambispora gerdemannii]